MPLKVQGGPAGVRQVGRGPAGLAMLMELQAFLKDKGEQLTGCGGRGGGGKARLSEKSRTLPGRVGGWAPGTQAPAGDIPPGGASTCRAVRALEKGHVFVLSL